MFMSPMANTPSGNHSAGLRHERRHCDPPPQLRAVTQKMMRLILFLNLTLHNKAQIP